MSLATPTKLKSFQRALYSKAKREPNRRFHFLYDKVWRSDVLEHAYRCNRSNDGTPGVDGQSFAAIEAYGVKRWLRELQEELRNETYKPKPVRRVMIPKPGGVGERPLGIPIIRDRVVQMAVKLVTEPIFEADFDEAAYGYRPRRSAEQAVRRVRQAVWDNHTEVIDADLSKFFDTIPHAPLMKSVARRISDAKVLHLIKMWLKAPVEMKDASGRKRLTGGKRNKCGTPQGGVLSPVLANLYMHRFIKAYRKYGLEKEFGAVLVNYADDFVILCRRNASGALTKIRSWFTAIGLEINESKTSVKRARMESFDFLGHTFKMLRSYKTGRPYPGVMPSTKAVKRLKKNIRHQLHRANVDPIEDVVIRLNRTLRGWANYFRYGSVLRVRQKLDRFVFDRVRYFLARRAKCPTRGTRRFPRTYVFGELGVVSLNALPRVGS
jgi:RNA-directed DNA polymerase